MSTMSTETDPPPIMEQNEAVTAADVKCSATDPAVPSSSSTADESCSTAQLLQYYDDCAEYYDQTDEGDEDTYICVDRVTASLLRAFHQPPVSQTRGGAGGARHGLKLSVVHTHGNSIASAAAANQLAAVGNSESNEELSSLASSPSPSPLPQSPLDVASSFHSLSLSPSPTQSPSLERSFDSPAASVADSLSSSSSSSSSVDSAPSSPKSRASSASANSNNTTEEHCNVAAAAATTTTLSPSAAATASPSSSSSSSPSSPSPPPPSSPFVRLRILDLGVGTGLASRPLFHSFSYPRFSVPRRSTHGEPRLLVPEGTIVPEIWGVDLSPNMLKVSSVLPFQQLIAADLNTDLRDEKLHPNSPLARGGADTMFDAVVCVGTTEFVHPLSSFLVQVCGFLRENGWFCGTFPRNQTQTYPQMTFVQREELVQLVRDAGMDVKEVQEYRGWSVSAEEHVEYTQILAQKRTNDEKRQRENSR